MLQDMAESLGCPLIYVSLKDGNASEALSTMIGECAAFKQKKEQGTRQRKAVTAKKKKDKGSGCWVC